MNNATETTKKHDGRNVKRIREILQVKQSTLAHALGEEWNQKKVSQLEDKETIDDKLMEEIAEALKVPVEAIRNFDEEKALNVVANNSFENCNQPASIFYNSVINPIDKWMEAIEENKRLGEENKQLYERLLQSEKDKVDMLQRIVDDKK